MTVVGVSRLEERDENLFGEYMWVSKSTEEKSPYLMTNITYQQNIIGHSVELTYKMQPCNRIYYSTVH